MVKAHLVEKDTSQPMNDLCEETYAMGLLFIAQNKHLHTKTVSLAGTSVTMEIDTGASVSLILEEWNRIKRLALQLTLNTNKEPLLHIYTGSTIKLLCRFGWG